MSMRKLIFFCKKIEQKNKELKELNEYIVQQFQYDEESNDEVANRKFNVLVNDINVMVKKIWDELILEMEAHGQIILKKETLCEMVWRLPKKEKQLVFLSHHCTCLTDIFTLYNK